MLEPAVLNEIPNRVQSPLPPVDVQGELEYEISEVLDSKIDRRRSCKLLYLVRWLGYKNTDLGSPQLNLNMQKTSFPISIPHILQNPDQ